MKRPSRRLFTELLVVSLAALVWSCAPVPPARVAKEKPVPISELSLEQKIAQMFMVRYSGNYVHESSYAYQQAKRLVQRYGIGGIILFYGSIPGTIENLNDLQSLSRIPLMVAADYERGVGQQLDGGTLFPTNMALAATGQPELANSQGMVTAREASSLGVHVVLAPVMDVNSNPDNPIINFRSFGDSPEVVSRFGVEFIKGIQQNGLFATAKHFPGHGDASADSHTLPPVISASRAEIEETDLAPFKAAIDAGVKVIMVGHLVVPSLDASSLPASVSPELNGRLLRNVMGYEGLIMTDAMEMGGITKSFWAGEAAIRAIEAGSDIVLLSMDVERAMDAVAWAVRSGRLPEKRVDESVRRIMTAKRKLGLWENRAASLSKARSLVGSRDFRSVASEIARKSITLVKDEAGLIPIPVGSAESLTHILLSTDEGLMSMSEPFRSAVSRIHGNVRTKFIYEPLTDLSIQELVEDAKGSDFILCTLLIRVRMHKGSVSIDETHRRLISSLQKTGKPVAVAAFGSPYVRDVDQISTYLCAYGYGDISQYAMADAIFGAAPISGKLPVDLSADLKRGQGIDRVKRKRPSPSERTFDFSEASAVLDSAIRDSIFPGAQVMVTKAGEVLWSYQTGRQTYDRDSPPVSGNTIYDLASLTKVVATTPVIMKLVEMKLLPLDEPVSHFLPEFSGNGREKVLIRNLLTHSSGLAPYIQFFAEGIPPEEVLPHILRSSLTYPPGDSTAYSDLGMMVLGAVIEKATGKTLDVLSRDWFFRPLDMSLTMYNPGPEYLEDIAPTEVDPVYRRGLVHGVVHDRNAWWLGGVAPHAGLFSTAGDLARYAQMMMDGGFLEGRRYFKRSTVAEFTRRQNIPPGSERAMGWDTPSDTLSSAGDFFSPGSYGHNGFTGTSLWIDPNDRIAVILLTNRVYPTRERGGMYGVRRRFHNAVMKTVKAP